MDSKLKDFMDNQQTEGVAHTVIDNFERLTGHVLTKDEQEFTIKVSKTTFEKYVIEHREDIFVTDTESQGKLNELLDLFTTSLSTIMVHYIYSRLEAYILYKQVKVLQEKLKES